MGGKAWHRRGRGLAARRRKVIGAGVSWPVVRREEECSWQRNEEGQEGDGMVDPSGASQGVAAHGQRGRVRAR